MIQQFIIQNFRWDKEENLLIASMESLGIIDPPYEFNIIGQNGNTVKFRRGTGTQKNVCRYYCVFDNVYDKNLIHNGLILGVYLTYGRKTP